MKKLLTFIFVSACAVAYSRPMPSSEIEGNPWFNYSLDIGTLVIPTVRPGTTSPNNECYFLSQGNNARYPNDTSPSASGHYTYTLSRDRTGDGSEFDYSTGSLGYPGRTIYACANPLSGERGATDASLTFDFRNGNHTLQFETGRPFFVNLDISRSTNANPTAKCFFKGGRWDLNTGYFSFGFSNSSVTYPGGYCEMSEGVEFTKLSELFFNRQTSNATLVITNGSKMTCTKSAYAFMPGKFNEMGSKTIITGGSKINIGSTFHTDYYVDSNKPNAALLYDDELLISGEGTEVKIGGGFYIGNRFNGVKVKIDDGALLEAASYSYFGLAAGITNYTLSVDRGATVRFRKSIYMGHTNGAGGHTICLNNGATLDLCNTSLRIGGGTGAAPNNTVACTNSTILGIRELTVGYRRDMPGNSFILSGPDASASFDPSITEFKPFGTARNGSIIVDNGCILDWPQLAIRIYANEDDDPSGNLLKIDNGATLNIRVIKFGSEGNNWEKYNDRLICPSGYGTTLYVGNNATLNVGEQLMWSAANTDFVVSNGLVKIDGQYAMYFGYKSDYTTHALTNNNLRLYGASPKFRTTFDGAQMQIKNTNIHFNFDYDVDGDYYREAPFKSSKFELDNSNEFSFMGIGSIQRNIDKAVEIPLFEADGVTGGWFNIGDEVIDKMNADLPAGCYVYQDNLVIKMHISSTPGMRVIVR